MEEVQAAFTQQQIFLKFLFLPVFITRYCESLLLSGVINLESSAHRKDFKLLQGAGISCMGVQTINLMV